MSKILSYDLFMSLKIVFILTNSADSAEFSPYATSHLELHSLPKYIFTCIQNEKGYICSQNGIIIKST